jgi:acyl-coenzyme A thioesterase PaaI-like protein
MEQLSLQDRLFAQGRCFGCGPANAQGLQLKSLAIDELTLEASWIAQEHHEAFPGVLNGGIIGTLLDCHSTWAAWWALFQRDGNEAPFALTAEYTVRLLRPTPIDRPLRLTARAVDLGTRRAEVTGVLEVDGLEHATSSGTFIRPKEVFPLH